MDSGGTKLDGNGAVAPAEDALVVHLAGQLEAVASEERELRRLLVSAHEQVTARDEEIRRLLSDLARERAERERCLHEATIALARVNEMRATRVWRLATSFWRVRNLLRPRP